MICNLLIELPSYYHYTILSPLKHIGGGGGGGGHVDDDDDVVDDDNDM
jgi:hypothetical protein